MSSTLGWIGRPTLQSPPLCCAPPSPFPTPTGELLVRCFCPHTLKEQWSRPVRTQIHSRHHSAQNPTKAAFFPQGGSQVLPPASKAHQDLLTPLPPVPSAPSHHLPTLPSAPPPTLSCRPWHLQPPPCLLGILPQIPTPELPCLPQVCPQMSPAQEEQPGPPKSSSPNLPHPALSSVTAHPFTM